MTAHATRPLDELARADPAVAPLAMLYIEVARAEDDPAWAAAVPALTPERLADGFPLLHGRSIAVERDRVRALLVRLAKAAASVSPAASSIPRAMSAGALDPLAVVVASITRDDVTIEGLAGACGIDEELLATLGNLAATPLLRACGRAAVSHIAAGGWDSGYCPVCAAWPLVCELRGLDRERWLRCGRCGAGWARAGAGCAFCGNADFRALGYLAPEAEPDARRAATCDACHGYLKTMSTHGPLSPLAVIVADLSSVELDMAALNAGYGRPDVPAFPLLVRVEPLAGVEAGTSNRRFKMWGRQR